jgi:hypothetical protein
MDAALFPKVTGTLLHSPKNPHGRYSTPPKLAVLYKVNRGVQVGIGVGVDDVLDVYRWLARDQQRREEY